MRKDLELKEYRNLLPLRKERSNKGTYGTLLLAAGSEGMAGAAQLSAMAAYRMGTGIVTVLSDESNRLILQSTVPEAIFKAYHHPVLTDQGIRAAAEKAAALAMGPGIGMTRVSEEAAQKLLQIVCDQEMERPLPAVMDADALNLLAAGRISLPEREDKNRMIITPHPGEMARLTGLSVSGILNDPVGVAESVARSHHVICVLKDHRSVVTDGSHTFLNPTGCDGMATAGSGDVLTGMIGGLLAQGCDLLCAARLGVFVHGLAGELAQESLGARSVMARDIIAHIADALKLLEGA